MTPTIKTPELVKTKAEALKQSSPLITQAMALDVKNEAAYLEADKIRDTIKSTSKKWSDRLALIIRPAYDALQSLYLLKNEICGPMDEAHMLITQKMKVYKQLEAAEIRRVNAEREKEELRLQEQLEEKQRKIEAAKSGAAIKILNKQIQAVEDKRDAIKAEGIAVPVKAESSGSRVVLTWKVNNLKKLLAAIVSGELPEELVEVNSSVFNTYFRADTDPNKASIRTWPGVTIVEDIQIVSKRK